MQQRKKLLIACEESGIVRDAFIKLGIDAVSCDILPTRRPGPHLQCDVLELLNQDWAGMIGFPPCTYLAMCQYWRCMRDAARMAECEKALDFFRKLWNAPIPLICLENPKSIATTRICSKSQTVHPWFFGHAEFKSTCA